MICPLTILLQPASLLTCHHSLSRRFINVTVRLDSYSHNSLQETIIWEESALSSTWRTWQDIWGNSLPCLTGRRRRARDREREKSPLLLVPVGAAWEAEMIDSLPQTQTATAVDTAVGARGVESSAFFSQHWPSLQLKTTQTELGRYSRRIWCPPFPGTARLKLPYEAPIARKTITRHQDLSLRLVCVELERDLPIRAAPL